MAAELSAQMYHAVTANDSDRLRRLIADGGDVDTFYDDVTNISSKSLLHVCCGRGHVKCLSLFHQIWVLWPLSDQQELLIQMSRISPPPGSGGMKQTQTLAEFPSKLKALLEADQELIHGQDKFGKSPLHCAVSAGSEELALLLLQFGADVNVRCHEGMTPLMYCCMADPEGLKVKVIDALLDTGAMVNLLDYRGRRSALHVAVSAGNRPAVERLIAAGADVNGIEKTLRTPLTLALGAGVKGELINEVFAGIISLLVSAGADLDVSVNESCNPLITATLLRSETSVRYFLSLGADPDVLFHSGVTPALVCASTGDLHCLQTLVQYNCKLNCRGSVYKRRRHLHRVLDPFELSYTEGYLNLCLLMVHAGYRLHRLRQTFLRDLVLKSTSTATSQTGSGGQYMSGGSTANTAYLSDRSQISTGSQSDSNTLLSLEHAQNLPEDWEDILKFFVEKATTPRSLSEEALFAVRLAMGKRLVGGVSDLPLPGPMKHRVMLGHVGLGEPVVMGRGLTGS